MPEYYVIKVLNVGYDIQFAVCMVFILTDSRKILMVGC